MIDIDLNLGHSLENWTPRVWTAKGGGAKVGMGRGLTLSPARGGFGVGDLMGRVDLFLGNPEVMQQLVKLGGGPADPGGLLPAEQRAWALNLVKNLLGEEMGGLSRHFSPEALQALGTQGLNTPQGRALLRVEALVSGRNLNRLSVEKGLDPDTLVIAMKVEQLQRLAAQGRYEVTNPQFREDPAFLPYIDLWAKATPHTQQAIGQMHREWVNLGQFRQEFVEGKRTYWHKVISEGKEAADRWDAAQYQPLRNIRDRQLNDPLFGPVMQVIQNEAATLHDAFAKLYQAKRGWWASNAKGEATAKWEQQGAAARERLKVLDPNGEQLWGVGRAWQIDQLMRKPAVADPFAGVGRLLEPSAGLKQLTRQQRDQMFERINQYDAIIQEAAKQYKVDPLLIKAIIARESGGNPNAIGGSGDTGLMQVVWHFWGYKSKEPLLDPKENIWKGTEILAGFIRQFEGDVKKGVQAYNFGAGGVRRVLGATLAAGEAEAEWTSFRSVVKGGNPRYLEDVAHFYGLWLAYEAELGRPGASPTRPVGPDPSPPVLPAPGPVPKPLPPAGRSPEPLQIADRTKEVHANNFAVASRAVGDISYIVMHHISAGGPESAISHWRNPKAGASAHYIVGHGGEIIQAVKDKDIAYHAGGIDKLKAKGGLAKNPYIQDAGFMSRRSIGIELQNDDLSTPFSGNWQTMAGVEYIYTDEQLAKAASLVAQLLKTYGLEPSREYLRDQNGKIVTNPAGRPFIDLTKSTVVGHGDYINVSGKYDEPREFPWDRFMEMVTDAFKRL